MTFVKKNSEPWNHQKQSVCNFVNFAEQDLLTNSNGDNAENFFVQVLEWIEGMAKTSKF